MQNDSFLYHCMNQRVHYTPKNVFGDFVTCKQMTYFLKKNTLKNVCIIYANFVAVLVGSSLLILSKCQNMFEMKRINNSYANFYNISLLYFFILQCHCFIVLKRNCNVLRYPLVFIDLLFKFKDRKCNNY